MALGILFNLYNKANKREWILSIADSADGLGIKDSLIERNRATALYRLGRDEEAGRAYVRAMEINSNDDQAVAWYAEFLDDAGKYQEAYNLFENAIRLDPADGRSYYRLGVNILNRGIIRSEDGSFNGPVSQKERIKAVIPLFMKALEISRSQEIIQRIVRVLVQADAIPEAESISTGKMPEGNHNYVPLNHILSSLGSVNS